MGTSVKRVWKFLGEYALVLACIVAAGLVTAEKAGAQVPRLTLAAPIGKIEPWRNDIFPYAQPPIYDDWWHEIAECEGLELPPNYKSVQFFAVNAETFVPMVWPLTEVYAVTYAKDGQIFMSQPLIWSRHVVTHEMLHWLLLKNGYNFGRWHPAEFFDECGLAPWGK